MINLIISDGSPTLVISYDPIYQSINAHFSKPESRDLTEREEDAMILIKEEFGRLSRQLMGSPVNQMLMNKMRLLCAGAINRAYHQTGIKFELDAQYLTC